MPHRHASGAASQRADTLQRRRACFRFSTVHSAVTKAPAASSLGGDGRGCRGPVPAAWRRPPAGVEHAGRRTARRADAGTTPLGAFEPGPQGSGLGQLVDPSHRDPQKRGDLGAAQPHLAIVRWCAALLDSFCFARGPLNCTCGLLGTPDLGVGQDRLGLLRRRVGPQVDPVLGRVVVEGEEYVKVLGDLRDCLGGRARCAVAAR